MSSSTSSSRTRKPKERDPFKGLSSSDVESIRSWIRLHEDKPEEEVVRSLARLWTEWLSHVPKQGVHVSDHKNVLRESEARRKALRKLGKANAELMDKILVLKRDLAMMKKALAQVTAFNKRLERKKER